MTLAAHKVAWPADVPEVSGVATATYDFKVFIVLPWDRYTESVLATRSDSWEKLQLVRGLAQGLQVQAPATPLSVHELHVSESAAKVFKAPGQEPGVAVLLSVRLRYHAHRVYSGSELRKSLGVTVNHARYPDSELRIEVRDNH